MTPGRSVLTISMLSLPFRPGEALLSPGFPASSEPFAAVRAVLYTLPPASVFKVPRHRGLQAGFQVHLRHPVKLVSNTRCIDGVAPIMARTIRHVADQLSSRLRSRNPLIEKIAQRVDDFHIGSLGIAADVVGPTRHTVFEHACQRSTVVGNEKPVAALLAVTVYRQFAALQGIDQHQRNELFRILSRA